MPGLIHNVVKKGAQKMVRVLGNPIANMALESTNNIVIEVIHNNDVHFDSHSNPNVRNLNVAEPLKPAPPVLTADAQKSQQNEEDESSVQLRACPPRRNVSDERTHGRYFGS